MLVFLLWSRGSFVVKCDFKNGQQPIIVNPVTSWTWWENICGEVNLLFVSTPLEKNSWENPMVSTLPKPCIVFFTKLIQSSTAEIASNGTLLNDEVKRMKGVKAELPFTSESNEHRRLAESTSMRHSSALCVLYYYIGLDQDSHSLVTSVSGKRGMILQAEYKITTDICPCTLNVWPHLATFWVSRAKTYPVNEPATNRFICMVVKSLHTYPVHVPVRV